MEFELLHKHWDAWGRVDPLFAILTNDGAKRRGGWDLAEFFATGRTQIATQMAVIERLPGAPQGGRMLDFGCGVGRLTQAFCRYFDECHGVDIARSMIGQAQRYNQFGDRCHYHVNVADDLRLFPDGHFDFVYTNAVLQHMRPCYAKRYIEEFVRILKPGGLASFELPSHRAVPEPLPPLSFRAGIAVLDAPAVMRAGVPSTVQVRVTNQSPEVWPSYGRNDHGPDPRNFLQLGNHWVDAQGQRVVTDDGRSPLTETLAPGASSTLSLEVCPPGAPGVYRLELDMVQEGCTWFADRGSALAQVGVEVRPQRQSLAGLVRRVLPGRLRGGPAETEPVMEMHCTPQAEVLALLDAAGARVLQIEPMHTSYHGFRYYVSR